MAGDLETAEQYAARLDAEDAEFFARMKAMREERERATMLESIRALGPPPGTPQGGAVDPAVASAVVKWTAKLPKDVGVAMWDTVRQGAELALDSAAAIADVQFQQLAPLAEATGSKAAAEGGRMYREAKAAEGTEGSRALRDLQARQGEDLPPNLDDVTSLDLRDIAPEFVDSVDKARAWLGQGDNQADVAAQKLFQFVGPFGAALRAMGGLSKAGGMAGWLASVGKATLADAATSYAAFDPHEARLADLLREFAPDNRLVNAYIDYAMSDPADTDAEGRWKNMVDNTLAGVPLALASAVYQGGKALTRATRGVGLDLALPGAPATQRGAVGAEKPTAERLPVSTDYEQFERALAPETRTELVAMRADAEAYLPEHEKTMRGIAEAITGNPANVKLAPVKGWDRIVQKVAGEEKGEASGIRDMARGTILVRTQKEAAALWDRLLSQLGQAPGTSSRRSLVDMEPDDFGYVDIKLNFTAANGRTYEVQATTPELWDLKKNGGHVFYEKARDVWGKAASEGRDMTPDEIQQVKALQRQSREHYAPGLEAYRSRREPLESTTAPLAKANDPSGNSSRTEK